MRIKTTLLFLTMIITTVGQAQWTTDLDENTTVSSSNSVDMMSASTSTGETYVVYWKNVGAPQNLQLRLQRLDANGVRQLGDEGVVVSDSIPMSTFTMVSAIAVDADDNLILAVTASMGYTGYALKLDMDGNMLWDVDAATQADGYSPRVLPLSNGNVMVAWYTNNQTAIQVYDADGMPVWNTPSLMELPTPKNAPASMHEMADGSAVVLLHGVGNFGVTSNLFAQKVAADGTTLWTEATQLSDMNTAYNKAYSSTQDGDVVYIGYSAAHNNRFDAYLQCIHPDGAAPWGMNGSDFDITEDDFEKEVQIAYSTGSEFVWANCTYTDNTQNDYGVYMQKFNKTTGDRILTDEAKAIFPLGDEDNRHEGALTLVNDNPLFVVMNGTANGASAVTLNAVYLNGNADLLWEEETRPMATYPEAKSRVNFSNQINGQSVLTFTEDKGNGTMIYAQNLTDISLSSGIEIAKDLNLLFKNPIQDDFRLTSGEGISGIVIYDVLGKVVYNQQNVDLYNLSISTSSWNSGLYIMSVETKSGFSKGLKLIKE